MDWTDSYTSIIKDLERRKQEALWQIARSSLTKPMWFAAPQYVWDQVGWSNWLEVDE